MERPPDSPDRVLRGHELRGHELGQHRGGLHPCCLPVLFTRVPILILGLSRTPQQPSNDINSEFHSSCSGFVANTTI